MSRCAGRVELVVERLGPAGEGGRDASQPAVRGQLDHLTAAPVEQLRQRVLEEREGAGAIGDVGDDVGEEARLEPHAGPLGGTVDRPFQVGRPHRRDDLGAVAQQLPEGAVAKRTVVEVGPEREHDAQRAVRVLDRTDQGIEERLRRRRARLREQLLELVDHEQQR